MFISLRYKFLFITSLLLVLSILTFLYLATHLFNTDKKAYIYDNNAALVDTFAEEINTNVQSIVKTLKLAALAYTQTNSTEDSRQTTIQELFREEPNLVDLTIYEPEQTKPVLHIVNREYLAPFSLDARYMQRVYKEKPINIRNVLAHGVLLQNSSLADGIPLVTVAVHSFNKLQNKSLVVTANMQQQKQLQAFNRTSVYTTYLIDQYGNLLAHKDQSKTLASENLSAQPVVNTIIASRFATGATEYTSEDGVSHIAAYRKLEALNLIVLSEITVEKAFAASARLVEKSVLFALLILAISFVVSILFTRRLTSALQRLYLATVKIGQGDFSLQLPVKSKDEVGSLSSAFNKMGGEIVRLLKETADKVRMEKELETAQLVQDNFFPADYVEVGDYEIASFFKPASECGGDWWGYFNLDQRLVLMFGDATGHGVGAALITAATHSCTSVLSWLNQTGGIQNLSASSIMSCLNAAVYHTGSKKVKMTFFVAILDLRSGQVSYCNASHDRPLICPTLPSNEKLSIQDLDYLSGRADPCLGEDLSAKFNEHTFTLKNDQSIIIHSDGLIECANAQAEEFGERRFLRSITKAGHLPAKELQKQIISEALEFYNGQTPADDITLVVIKRKAMLSQSLKEAV